MTIRLLTPYAQRPFNAITTFDASVEAGLIAAGKASADLTGGVMYYAPKPGPTLQSKQVAVGSVSLNLEEQSVVTLPEGQVLLITGGSGAAGAASRIGTADAWSIGVGDLAAIGPYADTQEILVKCTVGFIVATVREAVLGAGGGPGGGVSSVNVTTPVTKGGTASSPTIGMPAATTAQAGHMTASQAQALSAASAAVAGAGAANGLATLGADGLLAEAQRPSGGGSETYTSLSTVQIMTSITPTAGATVAFPSAACNAMLVRNTEGVDIEFQINATGVFSTIRADEERVIFGITNASEVAFRRTDFAVATVTGQVNNSQVTFVIAELMNVSANYVVSRQKVTSVSSGTYQTFAAAACAAVEVTNTSFADAFIKVNGGNQIRLRRGKSSIFMVGNANLLSMSGAGAYASGNPVVTLEVEVFNHVPGLPRRHFVLADASLGSMKQRFGTNNWSTGLDPDFVMMSSFMPFTRFNPKGKTISLFNVAANVQVLAGSIGATVANVAINTPTECNTVTAPTATPTSGSYTGVRVTTTNSGTNIIGSTFNNGAGIDTTGCDIHGVIKSVGSNSPTGMVWELFSTPDGSGSDYHELSVLPDSAGGIVPPSSYGARAFSAHLFTPVGAGADMTSIKYVRFRYISLVGAILQPERFMAVKKASDRATFIFTNDDGYAYSMNLAARAMSPYGWPGVICLSPVAASFGGNLTGGTLLADNCRALQNAHGWQVCVQNYNQESSKQITAREWRENQLQGMMVLASIGIDPEGLRDSSTDGGGPANTSAQHYREMPSVVATTRSFRNGPNSFGALFSGYISGTTLTVTAITSGTIVAGVLVGVGTDASQTIGALLTGTANTVGATYAVGVAQTLGSSGAPVAFCADNVKPLAFAECNPPGDPYSLNAYNWDGSAIGATDLQLFARMRLFLEQAIENKGLAVLATHTGWNVYYNAMVNFVLPWIAVKQAANLCRVSTLKDARLKQAAAAIA